MPHTILQHLLTKYPTIESLVLIREVKLFLAVGQSTPPPEVKIRIWLGNIPEHLPYSFELSHYVKTPIQMAPYIAGGHFQSELDAIDGALKALTSFYVQALNQGHAPTPSNNWMVPNSYF